MKIMQTAAGSMSRIVCGTAYFGTNIDEGLAVELMDCYYALGGRAIDTARVYGAWPDASKLGIAEAIVGRWLRQRRHGDVMVITKCAHPAPGRMDVSRLDRASLTEDAERSCEALGQCPDLTLLHRDDALLPVEPILESLALLRQKGLIAHPGCSNWLGQRIDLAQAAAAREGFPAFSVSQIQWSLADTTPEKYGDPTLVCMEKTQRAWYESHSLPLMAFSSQAKGFFPKAAAGGVEALSEKARIRFATPENLARLERVKSVAAAKHSTAAAVSLAYLSEHPLPVAAVVGCSSVAQMESSMEAAAVTLTAEECGWLENG